MGRKKKNEINIRSSAAEYLTFVASAGDNQDSVEMRYEDENIWLTQKMMATLYDVETHTINYHIKRIFADSELEESAVIRNFRITAADRKTYNTKHYALQMIIAQGFKVNSERAVQFRKWVNQIAKEYTIKGWVMDAYCRQSELLPGFCGEYDTAQNSFNDAGLGKALECFYRNV